MTTSVRRAPRAPPEQTWETGPWRGVAQHWEGPTPPADLVYDAQNMVFEDPLNGGAITRRPADDRAVGSSGEWQLFHVFNRLAGPISLGIQGGQLYSYIANSWTLVVTTANLATAGITLDASATCFAADFGATVVINDGVNQPFTWDGSSGAGGLVKLTNAPTKCFGRPAVYYGKVFFIKNVAANNADRATLVWSEENQANTGYEAGGFNNAWDLRQTNPGALVCLVASNEALYYFRERSIGKITGSVTPDFQASGVHDSVSTVEGTLSPRGAIYAAGSVWWINAQLQMFRATPGGALERLSDQILDAFTSASVDPTWAFYAIVVPLPHFRCVGFAPASGPLLHGIRYLAGLFLFSMLTGLSQGQWSWTTADDFGAVEQNQIGVGWDSGPQRYLLMAGCIESTATRITLACPGSAINEYTNQSWDVRFWKVEFGIAGRERRALYHFTEAAVLVRADNPIGGTPTLSGTLRRDDKNTTSSLLDITFTGGTEQWLIWGLQRELAWCRLIVSLPLTSSLVKWGFAKALIRGLVLPRGPDKTKVGS